VALLRGAALDVILDALDPGPGARTLLRGEGAAETLLLDQVLGHVAELRREILVNKQDVHAGPRQEPQKTVAERGPHAHAKP